MNCVRTEKKRGTTEFTEVKSLIFLFDPQTFFASAFAFALALAFTLHFSLLCLTLWAHSSK